RCSSSPLLPYTTLFRSILPIDRIAAIHARIPNTHLVMHGSSSVPQEWLAIIREHGGEIGETYGVPVEAIVQGIRSGVRKVNIDTDLRLAMSGAMRRLMAADRTTRLALDALARRYAAVQRWLPIDRHAPRPV